MTSLPILDVQQVQLAAAVLARFIWEAALLSLFCVLSWRVIPVGCARTRYAIGCAALLLLAAAPVSTALLLSSRAPAPHYLDETQSNASLLASAPAAAQSPDAGVLAPMLAALSNSREGAARDLAALVPRAAGWMAGLWAAGFLCLIARLFFSVRAARRLRAGAHPARDGRWREVMDRLAPASPVELLESPLLDVPVVVGWWNPAILVPASETSAPATGEVLAHELAHIERGDAWVNLGQCLVEAALFFHPAVWWLSSRVHQEREACCDDAAVRRCGDAQLYARALLELETSRAAVPSGALGASGSTLPNRIRRLAGAPLVTADRRHGLSLLLIGLFGALLASAVPARADALFQPDEAPLAVEMSGATDAGSIDEATPIGSVVRGHLVQVRACFEAALLSAPGLEGKLVFGWSITKTGAVGEGCVMSSDFKSDLGPKLAEGTEDELFHCISAAVRAWQFPPPKGGETVEVSYPFAFKRAVSPFVLKP